MSIYMTDDNGVLHKCAGTSIPKEITVDNTLDMSSINPVQNNVITKELNTKVNLTDIDINANTFAQTEMKKSKNLFDINTYPIYLQSANIQIGTDSITFTSTATLAKFYYILKVENNQTYTISVDDITHTTMGLFIGDSSHPDTAKYGTITTNNKKVTFTTVSDTLYIKGYVTYSTIGHTFTVNKLQLEKGSIATDYTPYYGELIHQNYLTDKSMTLIGRICLNSNDANSFSIDNINCQDGDIFRIIISGSTESGSEGYFIFDDIHSGYGIIQASAYNGSSYAGISTVKEPNIRTDSGGFFIDLTFGVTKHYLGSFVWFNYCNCSIPQTPNTTTYWKHYQGFYNVGMDSLNKLTISTEYPFQSGTYANIYKVGKTL